MPLNGSERETPTLECPALKFPMDARSLSGVVTKRSRKNRVIEALAVWWQRKTISATPAKPRCVVVATGGNLGGAILSTPLIKAVRNRFPETHIAVITNTELGRQLVEMAGISDSTHLINPPSRSLNSPIQWIKSLIEMFPF